MFVPVFSWMGIFLAVIGLGIGNIYMKAQLAVKREMSKAKAPVMGNFGDAIEGLGEYIHPKERNLLDCYLLLVSIRAYGAEDSIKLRSMSKIDDYSRTARLFSELSCWASIRVNVLGAILAAALASYFVYGDTKIDASNSGFLLCTSDPLV
jgi:hypothetical protein